MALRRAKNCSLSELMKSCKLLRWSVFHRAGIRWVQQQNALEMIILLYFQELKETEGIIFSDPSFKQIKHQKMHAESTSPQSL